MSGRGRGHSRGGKPRGGSSRGRGGSRGGSSGHRGASRGGASSRPEKHSTATNGSGAMRGKRKMDDTSSSGGKKKGGIRDDDFFIASDNEDNDTNDGNNGGEFGELATGIRSKKAKTGRSATAGLRSVGDDIDDGGSAALEGEYDTKSSAASSSSAAAPAVEEDPYDDETADERRVRLGRAALNKLAAEGLDDDDAAGNGDSDDDEKHGIDPIARRLQRDALKMQGKLQTAVTHLLKDVPLDESCIRTHRGHRFALTSICLTQDERFAFTSSKDGSIIHWNVEDGKKVRTWHGPGKKKIEGGHTDEVLSVAVSSDGTFLASGGKDKLLRVWDPATGELKETFKGHRDTLTSLAFRLGSHQLFSGSTDRTIKVWNLDQMAYIDTLFGHQSEVTCISSLYRDRALSAGGDTTLRLWKIAEESQLLHRGQTSSIDCVAFINEERYISGSQDGSVALWRADKKSPAHVIKNAHGTQWVTSVAALPFTDLVASGSSDGFIRLWKCEGVDGNSASRLIGIRSIAMHGFVNGLAFAPSGKFLLAAIGDEHRLGRWSRQDGVKNGIRVLTLSADPLILPSGAARKVRATPASSSGAAASSSSSSSAAAAPAAGEPAVDEDDEDNDNDEDNDDNDTDETSAAPLAVAAAAAARAPTKAAAASRSNGNGKSAAKKATTARRAAAARR